MVATACLCCVAFQGRAKQIHPWQGFLIRDQVGFVSPPRLIIAQVIHEDNRTVVNSSRRSPGLHLRYLYSALSCGTRDPDSERTGADSSFLYWRQNYPPAAVRMLESRQKVNTGTYILCDAQTYHNVHWHQSSVIRSITTRLGALVEFAEPQAAPNVKFVPAGVPEEELRQSLPYLFFLTKRRSVVVDRTTDRRARQEARHTSSFGSKSGRGLHDAYSPLLKGKNKKHALMNLVQCCGKDSDKARSRVFPIDNFTRTLCWSVILIQLRDIVLRAIRAGICETFEIKDSSVKERRRLMRYAGGVPPRR